MSEPTEAEWLEGNDPMSERERMESAMSTDNRTNEPTDNQILDYAKEDAEHVFPKRVYEISNGAYTSGYFKGYKAALVTAGRLAEKPTEAQVEAGARAITPVGNEYIWAVAGLGEPGRKSAKNLRKKYLKVSRAVLTAVLGKEKDDE